MITLTSKAAEKVKGLFEQEGRPNMALRVFVQGGGCSGLQYGLTFDEEPVDGDTVLESNGVQVLVDANSAPHLAGIKIDYVEDMMGAGFKFINPEATQTCGCGQSFR